jgi:RNA polymerase-binding protein
MSRARGILGHDVALLSDASECQEGSMGERVLRGSRLGTTSYETDRDIDLAPRREVIYDCPSGHATKLPMSADAELPAEWECRTCGATGKLRDGVAVEAKAGKHVRSHWDMLLERRSLDDLEDVLSERLAELHQHTRRSA